jgi:predicted aspartyl protease
MRLTRIFVCWCASLPLYAGSIADMLAEAHRLLRKDDVARTAELVRRAVADAPNSPAVAEMMGELHFRQGEIVDAQTDFQKASALDATLARAWWGLGRVADCNSLHRTAENYFRKAFELDRDDPDVLLSYAETLHGDEHIEALRRYVKIAEHYAEPQRLEDVRMHIDLDEHTRASDLRRLVSAYRQMVVPLGVISDDNRNVRGYTVSVSFNGRARRLLLDTGASGILLRSKEAEKAGLERLSGAVARGIGDQGDRVSYFALARQIRIGDLEFGDYPVNVTSQKALYDEDGIIGTDIFGAFQITLDFRHRRMLLDPLPGGEPERDKTHDREIRPELVSFTPVFRIDHLLLASTKINGAKPVLFIVDTGSSRTLLAAAAAAAVTKLHASSNIRLRGISGSVEHVSETGKVLLEFAGFHQSAASMLALDTSRLSKEAGLEISGILGISWLQFLVTTLNYHDGLVKFELAER